MELKEKNFEILKGIDIEDNIVWSLSYKFLIWNFLISDKYTRIIRFNTKKEALEFQNKLLGIEIPFLKYALSKKKFMFLLNFHLILNVEHIKKNSKEKNYETNNCRKTKFSKKYCECFKCKRKKRRIYRK